MLKQLITCSLVFLCLVTESVASDSSPSQMSNELRSMALNLKPNDIGITKDNFPHPVISLVMETGFANGSFTLSSIVDGTTSLYFSNGGGIIGGGKHQNVREASRNLLSGAQYYFSKAQKVTVFPKPKLGQVIFYFIAFDGVYSYVAMENDLGNQKDELSNLFFSAHNVISELRKVEQAPPRP